MYIAMLVYSILSLSMYVYMQWINSTKIYLQECPFYIHVSMYVSYESLRVIYYRIPKRKERTINYSECTIYILSAIAIHASCSHR